MSSHSSHSRPAGPAPRPGGRLAVGLLAAAAWACAGGGRGPAISPAPSALDRAVRDLEAGDFTGATAGLEAVAAVCESGHDGRRAVFLLALTALDPRNPDALPDRGAALAARYLTLPGLDTRERVTGESLYLLALAFGGQVAETEPNPAADTVDGALADSAARPVGSMDAVPTGVGMPDSAVWPGAAGRSGPMRSGVGPTASRFERCDDGPVATDSVDPGRLPSLPDSIYRRLPAVERDSLRAQATTLEAELDRIRRLLRDGLLPDTTAGGPGGPGGPGDPGGTGGPGGRP